jgi:hypothetical protein
MAWARNNITNAQEISKGLPKDGLASLIDSELDVKWYEAVEKAIEVLFEGVGITISSEKDPITGRHRYHEAILEKIREVGNPYRGFLGQGVAHDCLRDARPFAISSEGKIQC